MFDRRRNITLTNELLDWLLNRNLMLTLRDITLSYGCPLPLGFVDMRLNLVSVLLRSLKFDGICISNDTTPLLDFQFPYLTHLSFVRCDFVVCLDFTASVGRAQPG